MHDKIIYRQLEEYYAAFNSIGNLYSSWAKQKGLSYHTLFTLYAIYHSEGGCCQHAICDEWLIPKQTLNSVLKALEKEGYLSYRVQAEDRRNKIITFTPAGQQYAKPILDELFRLEQSVLEKIGEGAVQQMIVGNTIFYEKLKEAIMERN